MEVKQKARMPATFIIKRTTNDLLDEICKELNERTTIRVTKSQIVDILIQDAKKRDIGRLLLTY